jgi:hypothetical protein
LNYTKSVEYRLHIRRGTHARGTHAKGRINNQFLITRFSIREDRKKQPKRKPNHRRRLGFLVIN